MDNILGQLKELASQFDTAGRSTMASALDAQRQKLENPYVTLQRWANGHFTISLTIAGADMGFYKSLAAAPNGLTVEELAKPSGAALDLAASILRFLASSAIIEQRSDGCYVANDLTRVLTDENFDGAVRFFNGMMFPMLQAFPEHLKANQYRSPGDMKLTSLQAGLHTEKPLFEFMAGRPDLADSFHKAMHVQRTDDRWFTVFPVQKELETWDRRKVAFVDVGGSRGHICVALKEKFPELSGHLVLQDLPEIIQAVGSIDGVEATAHDFFTPQPVHGAKFYYLAHILHDWSDAKCVEILENIRPAMGPHSRVLIDEVVVPPIGAHWMVAQADITMLAGLNTRERTREEWQAVLACAGFELVEIFTYSRPSEDSVIMAVPK